MEKAVIIITAQTVDKVVLKQTLRSHFSSIRKKPRAMRVEEKIALALGIKMPPDIIETSPPA